MTRRTFISVALFFTILFCSTFVFANNDGILQNAGNGVTNVVKDTGAAVKRGVEGVGNGLERGAQGIAGAITDNNDDNNNRDNNDNRDTLFSTNDNNGDYTATRTNAQSNLMGMSPNTWTWFTLAIAAILIVALVWYYASQNNKAANYDD